MTAQTGPHIGPSIDTCWDDITHSSYQLGDIVYGDHGRMYRFVQFVDAVTYAKGHLVCRADDSDNAWQVTNDRSGGSQMTGAQPVGVVFQDTVPTEDQYGFVQIAGEAEVLAGASISKGDYLKVDSGDDGAMDGATEGTNYAWAIALEDITDEETGRALLMNMGY